MVVDRIYTQAQADEPGVRRWDSKPRYLITPFLGTQIEVYIITAAFLWLRPLISPGGSPGQRSWGWHSPACGCIRDCGTSGSNPPTQGACWPSSSSMASRARSASPSRSNCWCSADHPPAVRCHLHRLGAARRAKGPRLRTPAARARARLPVLDEATEDDALQGARGAREGRARGRRRAGRGRTHASDLPHHGQRAQATAAGGAGAPR